MTVPVLEVVLGLAAFCFLCQALEMTWHVGRLTMQPGWLGFTTWGVLAALRASTQEGSPVSTPSNVLLIVGGILAGIAFVTVLVTQRTKHALTEIHTLVNSHSDKQIERIEQLTLALQAAGVEVPVNAITT